MKTIIKCIFILLFFIMLFQIKSFANELDDENVEIQEIRDEVSSVSAKNSNEPILNSRAAIVFDRTSKNVLFEKNAYEKRAMASTTKIMTAIIVLENADLSEIVEVSRKGRRDRRLKIRIKKR